MLRIIPSRRTGQPRYHFRRLVPVALRPMLGKTEISLALHTPDKIVARERAASLYARTGQLFRMGRMADISRDDIIASYEKIISDYEAFFEENRQREAIQREVERGRHLLEMGSHVKMVSDFLGNVTPRMKDINRGLEGLKHTLDRADVAHAVEKHGLRDQVDNLSKLVLSCMKAIPERTKKTEHAKNCPSAPKLSEMAERHVLSDRSRSAGTIRDTRKTLTLFVEAFGDLPVDQITGTVAGEFRDLLFGLPTTHGKNHKPLPIRDAVEQAAELELETVSGKTVKNHFSRMSSLWSHLVQREIVPRNPWSHWKFDITKKIERRAWSDDELRVLLDASWTRKVVSERTYRGIVQVALYTGMRLGEICNLRNRDVEIIDGIPCFHIQPYTESVDGKTRDWSPKTAAGARLIPIHDKLLETGLIETFGNSGTYVFEELTIAPNGVRGNDFAQAFSKFKRGLGIPEDVTFHSFRHLVSTKLRNQRNDIRELWIDTLLGHEATHRSQGTTNYMSGIDVRNLKQVVDAIRYDM